MVMAHPVAPLVRVARTVDDVVHALQACARVVVLGPSGPITLLDHSLQCADMLALAYPEDVALQLAGLVHDLGRVIEPDDVVDHAGHSAHFVGVLLGARVAALVRQHHQTETPIRLGAGTVAYGAELRDVLALRRADQRARSRGASTDSLVSWERILRRETAGFG